MNVHMTVPEALPDIADASRMLGAGQISPTELLEIALKRIAALDPVLHAFIEVTEDRARAAARTAEARIVSGAAGPLTGIPYALKDIYDVKGIRTTAHSNVLINNVAGSDSAATERLEAAGMVLLGKLATHEFARGGPTDALPFPNARNSWNPAHFTGGSSSGSGTAVGAGMVGLAMGSDTGGSIRIPAACNGIVGMKPTYGRISRRGIVPLSFSMDHAGPLTRTVADCAMSMQPLAGHDPADPNSSRAPVEDYTDTLQDGIRGMRIGRARKFDIASKIGDEQMAAVDAAEDVLRGLGAEIVDVELPDRDLFDAVTWAIIQAEGISVHQQDLRERPEAYGRITRERLMMGAFATGGHYVTAQRLRPLLSAEVNRVLKSCHAILCAGMASTAPLVADVDALPWRKQPPITGAFDCTGHPAMVLPAGFGLNGLPMAIQLIGKPFNEAELLRIGWSYERAAGWTLHRPTY